MPFVEGDRAKHTYRLDSPVPPHLSKAGNSPDAAAAVDDVKVCGHVLLLQQIRRGEVPSSDRVKAVEVGVVNGAQWLQVSDVVGQDVAETTFACAGALQSARQGLHNEAWCAHGIVQVAVQRLEWPRGGFFRVPGRPK